MNSYRPHAVAWRRANSAGTATGCGDAFTPDFAGGTSSPNSWAALRPGMLRLASSLRDGSLVIELGASKSQCGQSDAQSNCGSALRASEADWATFMLPRGHG